MATHYSAKKRNRQNIKRRARNVGVRSQMKTLMKKVQATTKKEDGSKVLQLAVSAIHKAAQRGILHRNTASRRISNLTHFVNRLAN